VEFLGCPIDNLSMREAERLLVRAMERRERLQHGDVNVAKLIGMRRDEVLRRATAESDIICPDGMGVVWGCRLMGLPVTERLTGCDLAFRILDICARDGFRPYLFGAKPSVLQTAVDRIHVSFPGIQLAGWRDGYFKPEDEAEIVERIRQSQADCLLVGISSPIKERFLNQYRDDLQVPVQLGVGGTFDVIAGKVRRAPLWMQRAGLEWSFRLLQEPRRLGPRYVTSNAAYAWLLATSLLRRHAKAAVSADRGAGR
jgi:N-acetylglucosaminyldiphosphoundecaprenol N-acetyl-beta-D-mannosaminyltransferase